MVVAMKITEALDKFLIQLEADGRSEHTRLQYCRHVVHARNIGKLIDAAHDMDIGDRKALMRLNRFLAMQERQTNALMGLATKLRMTNQSRFTPQAAATRAKGRRTGKPLWED